MKKFLALLTLVASTAFGTTLAPVQLLNPTGSTAGQAILSTGPSTAPAWGNVAISTLTGVLPVANGGTNAASASGTALDNITGFSGTGFLTRTGAGTYAFQSTTNGIALGNLAQIGANSVLANVTGSTGNVAAFLMPSCNSTTNAIVWNPGSGFSCNTTINAATLGGATFAAPGAIGGTTAGTGAFTTLSASSTVSGTGFSNYLASPPAIGGTTPAAGKFTTLSGTSTAKVFATNVSGQSIPNNTATTITGWTAGSDQNSNFTASTGVFTAPVAGYYLVSFQLELASTVASAGTIQTNIVKTGVIQAAAVTAYGASGAILSTGTALVNCAVGDTITLSTVQTTGSAQALATFSKVLYLSIAQVP